MPRRAKPPKGKVEGQRSAAGRSSRAGGSRHGQLKKQLQEALEQQAATSEILRVISSFSTDIQPVLDTVAENAARLCAAPDVSIFLREAEHLRVVARHGTIPSDTALELNRKSGVGWAVLKGQTVHVADMQAEPDRFPVSYQNARRLGFRTALNVPLMRQGVAIGVISLRRSEALAFTERQVNLLETFAQQAVIAIENVRLFRELEEHNAELTDTLARQTATGEVLRAISRAQTDAQPVFDIIAESAQRLCGAGYGQVALYDGALLHMTAFHNVTPEGVEALRRRFPAPADRGAMGRALQTRAVVQIADVAEDPAYAFKTELQTMGFQSLLVVPMLHKDEPIGAIAVGRLERGAFPEKQIELLQTFADQAVIAIENVRLFKELENRNRDLSEALEQQTVTGEVLKVISRSAFDLEPVLDALIENAARLCNARRGVILRRDGGVYRGVAFYNVSPDLVQFVKDHPVPPGRHTVTARVALERRTIHVADLQADPDYSYALRDVDPIRTELGVPVLRGDDILGVIILYKLEVQPFTDKQIELVQTFADQAVIAIENARLLSELRSRTGELTRSVEELTALSDVSRSLSSTLDLDEILLTIVTRASQLAGTDACSVFEYDEATEAFHLRATNHLDEKVVAIARQTPTRKGEGVQGRMAVTRQPVQISDISEEDAYVGPLRDILLRTGTRAVLAVPMLRENELIGGLTVSKTTPGEFSPEVIDLLATFAAQSALAIQNARLFREIADKSRQLESASRHKSEFLANMSHELRTPLNAVIGFSEVLLQRMFGELNDKQAEYLQDIYASGQHLLSLINDILDLSKIEAGRMELAAALFHLPSALDNAVTLVKERAARHGIALQVDVDPRLGELMGDERKIKQVVLNLLSNAVKFTPEGGQISLKASCRDGTVEIAVTDTGIGIAPEDQAAIFEEFRQVGSDETRKQEGTGLGLTLAKRFVELHGGRLWVESEPRRGSTFTFTLPVAPTAPLR
ncbi:MAG TPA: GAF domain-containing protein [Methylomirabilota bacterium]|nr:GAF domain-containing protein [Methylomirabilota bacterium]